MADVEHKHLRSALEFAVLMAAEGQKRKPPMQFPKELKAYINKPRLPSNSLGRLRRVIENDAVFRSRLSAGALPELVDEIGRLWLSDAQDWDVDAAKLAEALDAEAASADAQTQLRRAEKRRDAAEQAAVRTRAELVQRDEFIEMQSREIDDLRSDVAKAADNLAEMKTELSDVRMEIRHARDREKAAVAKAATLADRLQAAQRQLDETHSATDAVPSAREGVAAGRDDIAAAAASARQLLEQIESMLPDADAGPVETRGTVGSIDPDLAERQTRPARRSALSLPGGVISTSSEAAAHLARSNAQFIVDGYNVAKLGWPNRPLEQQRGAFLDGVENLVRRFGTDVTVVFDGASVIGAHASRRRLVRVVYSPEGTTADDVIRDEVARIPTDRAVVVVTNDAEIVRDVRRQGANVVPSNALLAIV